MTKEEFLQLQELQRNSGLPLMKYLDHVGLKYSTYTYWKRKSDFLYLRMMMFLLLKSVYVPLQM
jgi:putative transposase